MTSISAAQEHYDYAEPSSEADTVARRAEELVLEFETWGDTDVFGAEQVSEYMHDHWLWDMERAMANIARGNYDVGLAQYETILLEAVHALAENAALEERP